MSILSKSQSFARSIASTGSMLNSGCRNSSAVCTPFSKKVDILTGSVCHATSPDLEAHWTGESNAANPFTSMLIMSVRLRLNPTTAHLYSFLSHRPTSLRHQLLFLRSNEWRCPSEPKTRLFLERWRAFQELPSHFAVHVGAVLASVERSDI